MEYMLLSDGTVRVYKNIQFVPEIRAEMDKQGGVAYYWRDEESWMFIHAGEVDSAGRMPTDIPDVITLAAMLQ